MTMFDGILTVLGCVLALCSLGYFLFRRQWRHVRLVLFIWGSVLVVYAVVLVERLCAQPKAGAGHAPESLLRRLVPLG